MNNINLMEDEPLQRPELKDASTAPTTRRAKEITIDNFKLLNIYACACQALKCIQTVINGIPVPTKRHHESEAERTLFSWSSENLFERRQYTLAWLDIMFSSMSPEGLEKLKILKDYDELQRFIKILVQTYFKEGSVTSKFDLLTSAIDMETIYQRMRRERKLNADSINEFIRTGANPIFYAEARKSFYEEKTSNEVLLKRDMRYLLNEKHTDEEFCMLADLKIENDLKKQIRMYQHRIETEILRSRSVMDACKEELDKLKPRLFEIENSFEMKRDKVDIDTSTRRSMIVKNSLRRQLLADQMLQYQEEIREMRKRTEAKELQNRALALQLIMPAKPKKKKKAGRGSKAPKTLKRSKTGKRS